jgi:hypothetical protein
MIALVLNHIAQAHDHPRQVDLRRALARLEPEMAAIGSEASALWLQSAPYDDGAALITRAMAMFRDQAAPPATRAYALSMLSRLGQNVAIDEIETFLMAENQTAAALDATKDAGKLIDRLFASVGCEGSIPLFAQLMTHALSFADQSGEDQTGHAYAKMLCDRAMRLALEGDGSQRLLDEVVKWIAVWPGSLITPLHNLIRTETDIRIEGLRDIALTAVNETARAYSAGILAERYAEAECRQAAELLVEVLSATRELWVAKEIFSQLPPRDSVKRNLAQRLMTASDWVPEMNVDPDDWYHNWLQQEVMNWRE